MRIQKVVASTGISSRRKVEDMISNGRIKVNGKVAKLGDKVVGSEKIAIDDKILQYSMPTNSSMRLILINKPTGFMCSHNKVTNHPLIYDLLPKLKKGKWMSVGRLDLNSQGLLLLTNNGDLLQQLLHPKQALKRVYLVRIRGSIAQPDINKMLKGLVVDGLNCKLYSIKKIKQGNTNSTWEVVLHEGRNREIRKMFSAINCQVNKIKRIAYGPFNLPQDLPPGKWFEVPADVVRAKL